MLELFGVAAVIVSPFAVVTFRRIRRDRAARAAATAAAMSADTTTEPGAAPAHDDAGPAAPGVGDVAALVARLRGEALDHPTGEWFDLVVPHGATLGGQPADDRLVARLVVDDLRRSGVEVDADGPGGRLRCRRT
jgi:hypothetical protein